MKFEDLCADPQALQDAQSEDPEGMRDIAAACYERLSVTMSNEDIDAWAIDMTAKYGPKCIVGTTRPLSWQAALAVVRYGGAPKLPPGQTFNDGVSTTWPDTFSAEDAKRARAWFLGKTPNGVRYLV